MTAERRNMYLTDSECDGGAAFRQHAFSLNLLVSEGNINISSLLQSKTVDRLRADQPSTSVLLRKTINSLTATAIWGRARSNVYLENI
ncbi:hypothetical protein MTP99_002684 [Tenebrio molitor]|nr:hypothetical protein MTP99_002684 [Tenebrio molitor]